MTRYETTVNLSGDEIGANGIESAQLLDVKRNGTGLKIVETGTKTLTSEPINRFIYQSINSSAPVGADEGISLFGQGFTGPIYRQSVRIGTNVIAGATYFITLQGIQVYYVAQAGDNGIDVQDGLKAQMDLQSYPDAVTVTTNVTIFSVMVIDQAVANPVTLLHRPNGYYVSKSGHVFNEGGSQYVFDLQVNFGYVIPTVPAVAASYDFLTYGITGVPNLLAYLYDPGYPTNVLYLPIAHGTANITNFPDFGTSLGANEVMVDEGSNQFRFGLPFELGNFEVITVLYKS